MVVAKVGMMEVWVVGVCGNCWGGGECVECVECAHVGTLHVRTLHAPLHHTSNCTHHHVHIKINLVGPTFQYTLQHTLYYSHTAPLPRSKRPRMTTSESNASLLDGMQRLDSCIAADTPTLTTPTEACTRLTIKVDRELERSLRELVRIRSVSQDKGMREESFRAAKYLARLMESLGVCWVGGRRGEGGVCGVCMGVCMYVCTSPLSFHSHVPSRTHTHPFPYPPIPIPTHSHTTHSHTHPFPYPHINHHHRHQERK